MNLAQLAIRELQHIYYCPQWFTSADHSLQTYFICEEDERRLRFKHLYCAQITAYFAYDAQSYFVQEMHRLVQIPAIIERWKGVQQSVAHNSILRFGAELQFAEEVCSYLSCEPNYDVCLRRECRLCLHVYEEHKSLKALRLACRRHAMISKMFMKFTACNNWVRKELQS